MALTPSTMLPLGTKAPHFQLPNIDGKIVSDADFKTAPLLLVMFICNHCPYVKHIHNKLAEVTNLYMKKGVAVVGINANDAENYPDDRPEKMREEAKKIGYTFPYLFDETQEVAKAYHAACTPEFYLFDRERKLIYRGQFDSSRPGNNVPVSGNDISSAMDAAIANKKISENQIPSIGCNIKWKPGNEPKTY